MQSKNGPVLPDKLHDGDTIKVNDRCFVEYIHTPTPEGDRIAVRITNQVGGGICIEGKDAISLLMEILKRT